MVNCSINLQPFAIVYAKEPNNTDFISIPMSHYRGAATFAEIMLNFIRKFNNKLSKPILNIKPQMMLIDTIRYTMKDILPWFTCTERVFQLGPLTTEAPQTWTFRHF